MPYGIGIIGAGPGAESLHLPTLDRLSDRFRAVHLADAGSGRAAEIAALRGIRSSRGIADLLADPEVEVVAICSPPDRHVEHVLAAVAAGVRGVLVEKPLALTVSDAERIAAACRAGGVALVVGTNHLHDPAWGRAKHHLLASGDRVRSITASVALPPNHPLHAAVTEPMPGAPAGGAPTLDLGDRAVAAAIVDRLVTGLLVHDLPLVRDLAPDLEEVVFARAIAPVGCAIGFRASGVLVQLSAVLVPSGGDPEWRVTVAGDGDRLDIAFPPSFVHAGAAEVVVHGRDGRRTAYRREAEDGYLAEWRALADLLDGGGEPEWAELVDDARYTAELAAAATDAVEQASPATVAVQTASAATDPVQPGPSSASNGSTRPVAVDPSGIGSVAAGTMAARCGSDGPAGVVALDDGFRTAVGGLPRSIRPTDDPAGAIVAGGDDPAASVVVLRAEEVPDSPVGARLVVVRRLLRRDVAADALSARRGVAPRLVVAECAATGIDDPAVADAIGWLRVLAGGPLRLVAHARTSAALLAAFECDGITATLAVTLGALAPGLRVRALGETTTEVEVDAAGRSVVATTTAEGRLMAPRRWESADREALRRALAVVAGAPATDLDDLRHDRSLAAAIIHDVHAQDRRDAASGPGTAASTAGTPERGDEAVAGERADTVAVGS